MRQIAFAALLLAGCGGPVTVPSFEPSRVGWSSMVYAASRGPILIEVQGNPFGLPPPALAATVAGAMRGAVVGHPVGFTADPGQATAPNFRVVVVLQPSPGLDEDDVCAGRPAFLAGVPPGQVAAFGAFCNGGRALTYTRGSVQGVGGAGDPRFLALMNQVARDLFRQPRDDPFHDVLQPL